MGNKLRGPVLTHPPLPGVGSPPAGVQGHQRGVPSREDSGQPWPASGPHPLPGAETAVLPPPLPPMLMRTEGWLPASPRQDLLPPTLCPPCAGEGVGRQPCPPMLGAKTDLLRASPGLAPSAQARGAGGYLMRFRVGSQVTPRRSPSQRPSGGSVTGGPGSEGPEGGGSRPSLLVLWPALTSWGSRVRLQGGR